MAEDKDEMKEVAETPEAEAPEETRPEGYVKELSKEEVASLDPHAAQEVKPPRKPEDVGDLFSSGLFVAWFDYGVYQVEKALCVVALGLMSVMMFMEMLASAMISEVSQVAKFAARILNIFGTDIAVGPSNQASAEANAAFETLNTVVGYVEIVIFIALCFAVFTHSKWTRHWERGRRLIASFVLVALLSAFGYTLSMNPEEWPSRYNYYIVFLGTLGGVIASWFFASDDTEEARELKAKRRSSAIAIGVAMIPLLFLVSELPDDYAFAQKYSLFLLLWVGFVGASMATYQKSHLKLDFIRKAVKGRTRHLYNALSLVVTLLFTALLLYVAYDYVFNEESGIKTTPANEGEIPDWIKVLSIPFAFFMMCLRMVRHAVEDIIAGLRGEAATEEG